MRERTATKGKEPGMPKYRKADNSVVVTDATGKIREHKPGPATPPNTAPVAPNPLPANVAPPEPDDSYRVAETYEKFAQQKIATEAADAYTTYITKTAAGVTDNLTRETSLLHLLSEEGQEDVTTLLGKNLPAAVRREVSQLRLEAEMYHDELVAEQNARIAREMESLMSTAGVSMFATVSDTSHVASDCFVLDTSHVEEGTRLENRSTVESSTVRGSHLDGTLVRGSTLEEGVAMKGCIVEESTLGFFSYDETVRDGRNVLEATDSTFRRVTQHYDENGKAKAHTGGHVSKDGLPLGAYITGSTLADTTLISCLYPMVLEDVQATGLTVESYRLLGPPTLRRVKALGGGVRVAGEANISDSTLLNGTVVDTVTVENAQLDNVQVVNGAEVTVVKKQREGFVSLDTECVHEKIFDLGKYGPMGDTTEDTSTWRGGGVIYGDVGDFFTIGGSWRTPRVRNVSLHNAYLVSPDVRRGKDVVTFVDETTGIVYTKHRIPGKGVRRPWRWTKRWFDPAKGTYVGEVLPKEDGQRFIQ